MSKTPLTVTHTDQTSGATTTTTINGQDINVVQTPPTNFIQGSIPSSSSTTTSNSRDALTTVNGVVIHEEHTTTGPTTVTGDAVQPADQQG